MRIELQLAEVDAVIIVWRKVEDGKYLPHSVHPSAAAADESLEKLRQRMHGDGCFHDLYLRVAGRSVVQATDGPAKLPTEKP
jgi:hypothetical protein